MCSADHLVWTIRATNTTFCCFCFMQVPLLIKNHRKVDFFFHFTLRFRLYVLFSQVAYISNLLKGMAVKYLRSFKNIVFICIQPPPNNVTFSCFEICFFNIFTNDGIGEISTKWLYGFLTSQYIVMIKTLKCLSSACMIY